MNSEITAKLKADIARIRAERDRLAAAIKKFQERQQLLEGELAKYESAAQVLASYGVISSEDASGVLTNNSSPPLLDATATQPRQGRKRSDERDAMLQTITERLHLGPATTEDLVNLLGNRGMAVTGSDPKQQLRNLSSILSRAKEELGIASTRNGWMLVTASGISATTAVDALLMTPEGEPSDQLFEGGNDAH